MSRSSELWIVTNLFPWPNEPNRATFNAQQFDALAAYCDVRVLIPVPWYQFRSNWRDSTRYANVMTHYFPFFYVPRFGMQYHGLQLWYSLKRALRPLKLDKPKWVMGSFAYPDGYAAARLARSLDLPYGVKVHGNDVNVKASNSKLRGRVLSILEGASAVIAVSQSLANAVSRLGVPRDRLHVVYNGINSAVFNVEGRDRARVELGLSEGRQQVMFVGNLKTSKGCMRLSEVAASDRLQAVDFHFIGQGAAAQEIDKLIEAGASNLHRHGVVDHQQLPDWYRAMDLVCLPSDNEGVPNVLLESMACGTPVLATDVGGVREVVATEAGRVIDAMPTREQLTEALLRALDADWKPDLISASVADKRWEVSARQLAVAAGID